MYRTIGDVIRAASTVSGLPTKTILDGDRMADPLVVRRAVLLIARDDLKRSFHDIAEFVHRDHSSVMTAVKRARQDEAVMKLVEQFRDVLKQPTWRDRVAADIAGQRAGDRHDANV